MKPDWQEEVAKFRAWAVHQNQVAEWELNYEPWQSLYQAIGEFLNASDFQLWTAKETKDLLYIIARDWECQIVSDRLRSLDPEITFHLARQALQDSDFDARWQLADVLGYLLPDARIEPLLLIFARDEEEYVRRRALQSLVRIESTQVEVIALREWKDESVNQEWARMYALKCLHQIRSPFYQEHLCEAEKSPLPYLSDLARHLRLGEVELL